MRFAAAGNLTLCWGGNSGWLQWGNEILEWVSDGASTMAWRHLACCQSLGCRSVQNWSQFQGNLPFHCIFSRQVRQPFTIPRIAYLSSQEVDNFYPEFVVNPSSTLGTVQFLSNWVDFPIHWQSCVHLSLMIIDTLESTQDQKILCCGIQLACNCRWWVGSSCELRVFGRTRKLCCSGQSCIPSAISRHWHPIPRPVSVMPILKSCSP